LDNHDIRFMKKALKQARKGIGRTSPNPPVGAVIVRDGEVIASGYHKMAGANHAEVEALDSLNTDIRPGDSMYVTLEPCNHHGKTPPCTEAIIQKGIKKVVVGIPDPNPKVEGHGIEFLRQHQIDVKVGLLENECNRVIEAFKKLQLTGRPFVIAKSAQTLDGWTGTSTGHSKWITNEKSRKFVHNLRDKVDGIMVGVGTIIADDPSLTTRLRHQNTKDPIRIVLDTNLRIMHNSKVLNHDSSSETFIVAGEFVSADAVKEVKRKGVSIIKCPVRDGRIDLSALMAILGRMSIMSVLVEGGAAVMGSMIREKLIDKFYVFKAPRILGGNDGIPMADGKGPEKIDGSLNLKDIRVRRLGDDVLIRGYAAY